MNLERAYSLIIEYVKCINKLKRIHKQLKEEIKKNEVLEVNVGNTPVDLIKLSNARLTETEKTIAKMEKNRKELKKLVGLYELAELKANQTVADEDIEELEAQLR